MDSTEIAALISTIGSIIVALLTIKFSNHGDENRRQDEKIEKLEEEIDELKNKDEKNKGE